MQKWEELAYAREEGWKSKLIFKVCKKYDKGKSLELIADELEEDTSVIEPILKVVERMAPNYDIEKISEEVAMLI